MTAENFYTIMLEKLERKPFHAFTVELADGGRVDIERPAAVAIRGGSALYVTPRKYVRFTCENVKQIDDAPLQIHASQ